MIILTSTTDKIQVLLSSAITTTQLSCFASYRDITSTTITPLRNVLLTNNVTAVDLVGSPASSTQRVVDYISVHNTDTATAEVIVRFVDNATNYRLCVIRLLPGEKLEYQEGEGFKVISNGYATKTITTYDGSSTESGFNMLRLNKDISLSNASAALAGVTIPTLQIPVKIGGTYYFKFVFFYEVDSTSNGIGFDIFGPTGTLSYQTETAETAASAAQGTALNCEFSINSYGTFDTPANSAATTGNVGVIEGFLVASADGMITPQAFVELAAGSVTVKAGSFVQYQKTL